MSFLKNFSVLLLLPLAVACSDTPPEQAIRAHITAMQQAVKEKKSAAAVEHLAEHFTGSHGLDKQGLRRMLIGLFVQHRTINVAITRMDITVNEYNPVSAKMEAVVLLTGAQGLLPQDGEILNISGDWELLDGEWLLVNARWE
ncbi:MAG TPA: hypothetical protein VGL10_08805 [Gammaproteobacteria bacterium]